MKQDNTDRMFDQRVVRRNISTGRITSDDYDRFLTALPDVGENIKPAEEGGDNDGYDAQPPEDPNAAPAEGQAAEQLPGDPAAGFGSPAPAPAAPAAPIGAAPVAAPPVGAAPAAAPVDPAAAPAMPAAAPPIPGTEPPTGA